MMVHREDSALVLELLDPLVHPSRIREVMNVDGSITVRRCSNGFLSEEAQANCRFAYCRNPSCPFTMEINNCMSSS